MFKNHTKFYLLVILNLCLFKHQYLFAQNVGIGTTSPHTSAKLDIEDTNRGLLIPRISIPNLNAAAPVNTPAVSLLVYNTSTTTGLGYYYWNGSSWIRLQDQLAGDHDWYRANTNSSPENINNNIFTMGNVGIGTNNPLFQFEMHGQAPNMNLYRYDNTNTPAVFRANKARGTQTAPIPVLANDGLGGIYFGGYNGTGWSFNTTYILSSATETFSTTNNGSNLSFYTTLNGTTTTTEKMRISHNGNVGIGTTTPSTALQVNRAFEEAFSINSGSSDGGKIYTKYVNAMAHLAFEEHDDPFILEGITSLSGQSTILSMYNSKIGIGTVSPTEALDVSGTIAYTKNQYNDLIIHDDTTNLNNDNISIEFVKKGNHTTPSSAIKFDGFGSPSIHQASMHFYTREQTDTSLQEQMMIHWNGNIGMGTNMPTEKLEINGAIKITDGTQGAGKVLVSDASGKGSWELPSAAPSLVPPVSIGPMAIGDSCAVGGHYTTASVTLQPGIYNYTLYSCANQIGQVGSGFNISAVFLSGSGDASGTWHTTSTGSCGHYYTGIVRVTTPSQIAIRYSSYNGSSFKVPGANTEVAQFWKIN